MYEPVAELDVEKLREDVGERRRRDAMKTVEYNYRRQFVAAATVTAIIISRTQIYASAGDARQILTQLSRRLTVNVEHRRCPVAQALSRPDRPETTAAVSRNKQVYRKHTVLCVRQVTINSNRNSFSRCLFHENQG